MPPRRSGPRSWPVLLLLAAVAAVGQEAPYLAGVFPPGGTVGSTVEVTFEGGVSSANRILVHGSGVTGQLAVAATTAAGTEGRALMQDKCVGCHEFRSPENRAFSAAQWETVVDRMINQRGADIAKPDRDKIVAYLKERASAGKMTARLQIAPDAAPGRREIRVATPDGVSSAYPFYVSALGEVVETEDNNTPATAQRVSLPTVVNGRCHQNGDVDYYQFHAKQGQRLLLRAIAYGLNRASVATFDACLFLYDASGNLLGRSLGFEDLDPLIDFDVPATGDYLVEVRDLVYRGNAASIYRLELGELGYHQAMYPLGGQRGQPVNALIYSANQPAREWVGGLPASLPVGVQEVETPFGLFRLHLSDHPDRFERADGPPQRIDLPCVINGWIGRPGETDRYLLDVREAQVSQVVNWLVMGPFEAGEGDPLLASVGPEADLLAGRLDAEASYPGVGGLRPWEPRPAGPDGTIALPNGNNQVWYAVHQFQAMQDSAGVLALGSDDGVRVWLNGRPVHTKRARRPVRPAEDLVPVEVRRGRNVMVLKVLNESGIGGFNVAGQAYAIDVFARRLGSPLRPRIRLGLGDRWIADSGTNEDSDPRLDWSFSRADRYGLQVEDLRGQGGDRYAYRVEIAPTRPSFNLRAIPANPSVPRGGRVAVMIHRSTLRGYSGDLRVRVEGLPTGVRADEAVVPADHEWTVLTLEAAADAAPAVQPIRIIGEAPALGEPVRVEARGIEHYRVQNRPMPVSRNGLAAAVVERPAPFRLSVTPTVVQAVPGRSVPLRVSVEREGGFRGDISLVASFPRNLELFFLPSEVEAGTAVVQGNRNTATINLEFRDRLRRAPFGVSAHPEAYRFVVLGRSGGDGISGGMMYSSEPVVIQPWDPASEPAQPRPEPGGTVQAGAPMAEHPGRRLFEQRCGTCHRLYEPTQTRKTPAAWAQTVDQMTGRGARLNNEERQQVVAYLQSVAQRQ